MAETPWPEDDLGRVLRRRMVRSWALAFAPLLLFAVPVLVRPVPRWVESLGLLGLVAFVGGLIHAMVRHQAWEAQRIALRGRIEGEAQEAFLRERARRWPGLGSAAAPPLDRWLPPARFPDLAGAVGWTGAFAGEAEGQAVEGVTLALRTRRTHRNTPVRASDVSITQARWERSFDGLALLGRGAAGAEALILSRGPTGWRSWLARSRAPQGLARALPTGDAAFDAAFEVFGHPPPLEAEARQRLLALGARHAELRLSFAGAARLLLLASPRPWDQGAAGIATLADALALLRAV